MRKYEDLDPKGKFIRTIVFTVIYIPIVAVLLWFLYTHYEVSIGFTIKTVAALVLCLIVNVWQIIKTYSDWKRY